MRNHAVRFSTEAEQNAVSAAHDLATFTKNRETGLALYRDFYSESGNLATFPDRYAVRVNDSAAFGVEVRALLVRGRFHLLYRIEDSLDGPVVTILCIRSAYADALTDQEAARIMGNQ